LTALATVVEAEDGSFDAWVEFWTPRETLRARQETDRVPYDVWVREGHLFAIPGATVDYRYVAERMGEIAATYELAGVAFDRWRMDDMRAALEAVGVELPLIECGQGFKDMSPAVEQLEAAILNRRLRIRTNPVLRWNVSSTVLETDPAGNRKFTKRKATGRIDGVVALAMAIAKMKFAGAVRTLEYTSGDMYGGR
jgi:phage terminase large subunit-like protein